MRYINIKDKEPPVDWQAKAIVLTQQLRELSSSDERKEFINDTANRIWGDSDFKEWLKGLFHNKCWYSEAKDVFSYYDVDHFRPKSKAKQLDGTVREGYWWLAFDWRNYRICGAVGNTSYKGYYFPLRDGSPFASGPEFDLNSEIKYLLDPTDPNDPLWLTFDESGFAVPAGMENTWGFERAKVTIKFIGLNYRPVVDKRKELWNYCTRLIIKVEKMSVELNKAWSDTLKGELEENLDRIRELIKEDAELSSTAIACLFHSGRTWAKQIVTSVGR